MAWLEEESEVGVPLRTGRRDGWMERRGGQVESGKSSVGRGWRREETAALQQGPGDTTRVDDCGASLGGSSSLLVVAASSYIPSLEPRAGLSSILGERPGRGV